jgi:hypothetical protein
MRDPYWCDGPTILNVSLGRTSSYLLHRTLDAHDGVLPPDCHPVFANTGEEIEATLDFGREIADRWGVDLRWIERSWTDPRGFVEVDYETASREGQPFDALIERKKFLPNPVMRFCTEELKIKPAAAFMRAQGYAHWTSVVGLRYDEAPRVAKIRARVIDEWDVAVPLYDDRRTVADVRGFWSSQPFDLRAEAWEGNCGLCFLKSVAKRRRVAEDHPAVNARWIGREERVGGRFRKDGPSYAQLARELGQQLRLHLNVVDDEADDLAACGCTDRRPARTRWCICGSRKPPGRQHTLACIFARADAARAA